MYSRQVLDHFEHPRNAGVLESPDAVVQVDNPVCGDVLKLSARIFGDQIAEIKFQAKGCVPAMACGSALTDLLLGQTLECASKLSPNDLISALGGLPPASTHAAHLAIDALTALLHEAKKRFAAAK